MMSESDLFVFSSFCSLNFGKSNLLVITKYATLDFRSVLAAYATTDKRSWISRVEMISK